MVLKNIPRRCCDFQQGIAAEYWCTNTHDEYDTWESYAGGCSNGHILSSAKCIRSLLTYICIVLTQWNFLHHRPRFPWLLRIYKPYVHTLVHAIPYATSFPPVLRFEKQEHERIGDADCIGNSESRQINLAWTCWEIERNFRYIECGRQLLVTFKPKS